MEWVTESWFRPDWQEGRHIHVIGCGALGSRYVLRLLGAGAQHVHVYDHDIVEARNCQNQSAYTPYIGMPKVEALRCIAQGIGATENIIPHEEKIEGLREFPGIVLFGLDSNLTRRAIGTSCIRENPDVSFLGDGRMGASGGRCYGLDPVNLAHVDEYFSEKHLPPDPIIPLGGCVQTPAAAPTADLVASHVLWMLGRWLHLEQGCPHEYVNYIGFELVPTAHFEVESWS